MISRLKKEYGSNLEIKNDDDEWFKKIDTQSSPGENIRNYRENMKLTQNELGIKLGNIPRQNISALEKKNCRGVSKVIAKKLSSIFHVPIERFLKSYINTNFKNSKNS